MPIDLEKLRSNATVAAKHAGDTTDANLAKSIDSFARLDDQTITRLFPEPADRRKAEMLVDIARSSESQNRKVKRIRENLDEFADVMKKLLKHLG